MFEPSLLGYSTGSQKSSDIPLRKTNTGQERLSFFGQKIWSRINSSKKILNKVFFHTSFKEKYFISSANSSYFK